MYKLASVALSAALGIAGVSHSVSAEAHPYVRVGIALPGIALPSVAVVEPSYAPGYYAPYYYAPYYAHGRYWHRDYDRDRYEHFHRHWDRR